MMESLKVIVVEDDLFTRRLVEIIIKNHFTEFEISASTGSVKEARKLIESIQPDLVILDIQLEDGNAFDLLKQMPDFKFKLVFMSSYQSYMEEAVQFAAVDFIKKPFDESDFVMALDKSLDSFSDQEYPKRIEALFSNIKEEHGNISLLLITKNGNINVDLKSVEYGESISKGSLFHLNSGVTIQVPQPLRRYESLLSSNGFFRCHPLILVNLRHIETIDTKVPEIHLQSGKNISVEAWRLKNLQNKYNALLPLLLKRSKSD